MFASGKGKQATRHRLAICCAASDCRHLCRWLLKGPGVDDVWCAGGPEKIRLYGALADPNFACPLGRF